MINDTLLLENDMLSCYFPSSGLIPGYIIIFLKGSCTSIDQLSKDAGHGLIDTMAAIQAAIKKVINPERIYTLSIGEIQPKLHFHIFPRTQSLLLDYQSKLKLDANAPVSGMHLFEWARKEYETKVFDNYHVINDQLRKFLMQS